MFDTTLQLAPFRHCSLKLYGKDDLFAFQLLDPCFVVRLQAQPGFEGKVFTVKPIRF